MSWKDRLERASVGGVPFHVDVRTREGGRRAVVHEFPHRDVPLTEDLGRRAGVVTVRGYTIGDDYDLELTALEAVCNGPGPLLLIMPRQGAQLVVCDLIAATETRVDGGYGVADMTFFEAGAAVPGGVPAALPVLVGAAVAVGVAARSALAGLGARF
ncbi:MAG: DNA circularization N-terminal domain-containing protein [Pseudomonadota bacterium]